MAARPAPAAAPVASFPSVSLSRGSISLSKALASPAGHPYEGSWRLGHSERPVWVPVRPPGVRRALLSPTLDHYISLLPACWLRPGLAEATAVGQSCRQPLCPIIASSQLPNYIRFSITPGEGFCSSKRTQTDPLSLA